MSIAVIKEKRDHEAGICYNLTCFFLYLFHKTVISLSLHSLSLSLKDVETFLHILYEVLKHRFKYSCPVYECLKSLHNGLTLHNDIYKTSSC